MWQMLRYDHFYNKTKQKQKNRKEKRLTIVQFLCYTTEVVDKILPQRLYATMLERKLSHLPLNKCSTQCKQDAKHIHCFSFSFFYFYVFYLLVCLVIICLYNLSMNLI